MDTSNTIDFLMTGKTSSLSNEEWARFTWRVIDEIRPSFEHFLGFRPLREFHEQTASGTIRSFVPGYLVYPGCLSMMETYCKELVVLLATSRGEFNIHVEHHEKRSLLVTRQAQFLIQNLKYSSCYDTPVHVRRENVRREKVMYCEISVLDCTSFAEFLHRGGSIHFYKKVIDSIVALAGDTWGRRQKMVEKDLETYKKLQAISGRVSSL